MVRLEWERGLRTANVSKQPAPPRLCAWARGLPLFPTHKPCRWLLRCVGLRRLADIFDIARGAEAIEHDKEQRIPVARWCVSSGGVSAAVVRQRGSGGSGGASVRTPLPSLAFLSLSLSLFHPPSPPPFPSPVAPVVVQGQEGTQQAGKAVARSLRVGALEDSEHQLGR